MSNRIARSFAMVDGQRVAVLATDLDVARSWLTAAGMVQPGARLTADDVDIWTEQGLPILANSVPARVRALVFTIRPDAKGRKVRRVIVVEIGALREARESVDLSGRGRTPLDVYVLAAGLSVGETAYRVVTNGGAVISSTEHGGTSWDSKRDAREGDAIRWQALNGALNVPVSLVKASA